MSEKMFGTRVDDVDSSIINIIRDGEDFAWFLSDIVTDKQVEKVVDKLNELSEEKEYFERKKEYFLSEWSIVNVKNIQLRQEIDDLKEENEQLKQEIKAYPINEQYAEEIMQQNQKLRIERNDLRRENEQLKNYFKKRAECSNFQINKLKEEIAELQEDNVDTIVELSKENEQLRQELQGMDELLQSYRKTIKHDAELLADASKNGYLPPLNNYVSKDGWICGCCKHFHSGVMDRCDKGNNWVLTDWSCQDFER